MFTVKYGDDYLTDYVKFLTIDRGAASESLVTTEDYSGDGVQLLYTRRDKKDIPFTFHVIDGLDVNYVRRKLAEILSTTSSKELVFSDEPNYYYNAIMSGKLNYTDDGYIADGRFTLLISDGVAHRRNRIVLNSDNSGSSAGTIIENVNGSIKAILNNNGTKEACLKIILKNNAENGYFGIVNPTGVMEVGNKEEADGFDYTQSETLLNAKTQADFENNFSPSTLAYSPQNSSILANGTLEWQTDGLRHGAVGTGSFFHGGQQVFEVPADSEGNVGAVNFRSDFNIFARADALGQTGLMQVMFTDTDDNFLFGYGVYKFDNKGNTAKFKFWDSDKKERLSVDFEANNAEKTQKKPNTAFNQKAGAAYVIKEAGKVSYYYNGGVHNYTDDNIATTACSKIYVFIGQYGTYSKFVGNLSLRSITFVKNKVEKWKDVPNRYTAGSIIQIDSEDDSLFYNSAYALSEKVSGSDFLMLPIGQSELDIYQSNWNTTPAYVELSWEELIL